MNIEERLQQAIAHVNALSVEDYKRDLLEFGYKPLHDNFAMSMIIVDEAHRTSTPLLSYLEEFDKFVKTQRLDFSFYLDSGDQGLLYMPSQNFDCDSAYDFHEASNDDNYLNLAA